MKNEAPPLARLLVAGVLLVAPAIVNAQAGRLDLPDLGHLAAKARESVVISLDGDMLKNAGQFMSSGSPPEVQQALRGIGGVYIRVFEFDQPGAWSPRDLDGVRQQLRNPGWKSLMSVQSRGEQVDMYLRDDKGRDEDGGMALVVSEPTSVVIINLVGKVDLEKLRQLQGKLGVPAMPGILGQGANNARPAPAPPPPPPPAAPSPSP